MFTDPRVVPHKRFGLEQDYPRSKMEFDPMKKSASGKTLRSQAHIHRLYLLSIASLRRSDSWV